MTNSAVGEQVLEELRAVQGIVAAKASPEETAAFGTLAGGCRPGSR